MALTDAEWLLVDMLARHPGRLIAERALLEQIGGPQDPRTDGALPRSMAGIRAKLEPDPARPRYLLSEPDLGWRLLAS